jgi:hypothetical protein
MLFLACAAIAPADALWDKAVALTGGSTGWIPSSASVLLQLLDPRGLAQDTWQSWFKLTPAQNGAVSLQLVRSTHNGDDTTDREQKSQRQTGDNPIPRWDTPFDPAVQKSVSAAARGQSEAVEGRTCALYDFTMTKGDGTTLHGTAWLDQSTGAPVMIRYSASRLPRGIVELTTTLRYSSDATRQGFLREALVEGVGGILFVRRSFRSVITIDDWARSGSS